MRVVISDDRYRLIKVVLMVVALCIAYLYVLNDRYVVMGTDLDDFIFDKWKNETYPISETWFGS